MLKCIFLVVFIIALFPASHALSANYAIGIYATPDSPDVEAAVRWIKENYQGRILSAKGVRRDGGKMIRVKLLTPEGVVKVVFVSPEGE